MPLLLVPYTMGSEMGVASTPVGGAAYYRHRSWWWTAAIFVLFLVH